MILTILNTDNNIQDYKQKLINFSESIVSNDVETGRLSELRTILPKKQFKICRTFNDQVHIYNGNWHKKLAIIHNGDLITHFKIQNTIFEVLHNCHS